MNGDLSDQTAGTSRISFDPGGIYFDGPTSKYLVETEKYFRTYGRKGPVVTGVERFYCAQGCDSKEALTAAKAAIADAEIDRHVEWSGNLAGHRKGLIHSSDGKPMLVLTSPNIIEPIDGPAPIISSMLHQAFPDQTQYNVFVGWLVGCWRAVRAGIHHPAPMLGLAGGVNLGKSLVAYLVTQVAGGRAANPHSAWTGSLPWNDDLCAAELLLLDDCEGSSDIRSRINLGSRFKEAIYGGGVEMKKRHCSSITVRPVWRVMICMNDNPESLLILPPINSDLIDKVILLRMQKITPPVDTSHPEGRKELQRLICGELPQFVAYLTKFQLPEALRDSRGGVIAWRHPELTQAIESTKPESRLEELICNAVTCRLWDDLPRLMTATEIEGRLIDRDSPVRDQAKAILTWSAAAGTYLSRLADGSSPIIETGEFDSHNKRPRYWVKRP